MIKTGGMLGIVGLLIGAHGAAVAQTVTISKEPKPVLIDDTPPRDDPFGLDGIAETVPEVAPPKIGFQPAARLPAKMPEMTLRGIGRMDGDAEPTALLDIAGFGLFVVTVDDRISLQGLKGDNVMRIVAISDISVTVETGSYGELIVVR